MENVLYLWGRRSNVFINFMLSILLSNAYNINLYSSYDQKMVRGKCGTIYGLKDQSHHVAEGI